MSGILLSALIVLGVAARLYQLNEKSLWSDEIATIATSRGNAVDPDAFRLRGRSFDPPGPVPASEYRDKAVRLRAKPSMERIARVLKANVHPPLFFWLMALWSRLVGADQALIPAVLRLPAVLFGILSIPFMYLLARLLWRLRVDPEAGAGKTHKGGVVFALLSTTFFALSAYQIDHAQDARAYTLLLCLALLAACLTIRLLHPMSSASFLENPGPWFRKRGVTWLVLALTLVAGLYTQYFFSFFAAFLLSYLLMYAVVSRRRELIPPWLCAVGLIVLLFVPWLPFLWAQGEFFRQAGHYTAGLWAVGPLPEKLWRILCGFVMPLNSWAKILPLVIIPLALISWLVFRHRYNVRKTGTASFPLPWISLMTGFLLLWLLIPLLEQLAVDLVKHTHTATIRRYLLLLSPACYLLLAHALTGIARWIRKPWGVLLSMAFTVAILTFLMQGTIYQLFRHHVASDEFKQAAYRINHLYREGDLVLVNKSGAIAVGMAYYLRPYVLMMGLDTPDPKLLSDGSPLMMRVDRALAGRKRIWLVFSHSAPSTERALINTLTTQGYYREGLRKFPGVRVLQWRKAQIE